MPEYEDCACDPDKGICCHDVDHCYCVEEGHTDEQPVGEASLPGSE
jgi:hypothetical protein